MPLTRPDRRALFLPPRLPIADRIKQAVAGGVERHWRALIACAAMSTMLCSGAFASDPIARALTLIAQERYPEAREVLDPLLQREPNAPGVRLVHGVYQARQGNYDEAIVIYESLRHEYPNMFEAHNNLAVLYAKLGRLDEALKTLTAALELRPDALVYANLGDLYMQLADRAYRHAQELYAAESAASQGSAASDTAPARPAEPVEPSAPATEAGKSQDPVAGSQELESARQAKPKTESVQAVTPEPESVEAVAPEPVLTALGECVRAGVFKDRTSAAEAAAWMRSYGAEAVAVRQEEREVIKNYHVYLPPHPSRAAATEQADELRRQGVSDIWIINEGARTNGISLGVYRNERYMRRRVAELKKLGYAVVSAVNMRIVSEYAVEASLTDDRAAFDDAWTATYRDHTISTVGCAGRN